MDERVFLESAAQLLVNFRIFGLQLVEGTAHAKLAINNAATGRRSALLH